MRFGYFMVADLPVALLVNIVNYEQDLNQATGLKTQSRDIRTRFLRHASGGCLAAH